MSKQEIMTSEEYRKFSQIKSKARKYHNTPKTYNGRRYQSTLEVDYAINLDYKIKAGIVKEWTAQYKIPIHVKNKLICNYIIDFKVIYEDGHVELVECKGVELPDWKLKWKLAQVLIEDIEPGATLVLIK